MSTFGPFASDPTMRTYHLNCHIFPIVQGHNDVRERGNGGLIQSAMICLIPTEGTVRELFLSAWAPVNSEETPEVMCMIANVGMAKACVCVPNQNCTFYHLFVMSQEAEEKLLEYYNTNKTSSLISVSVLPETTEAQDLVNESMD